MRRNPGTRAIDIARALGCTEAEALSALSDETWVVSGAHLAHLVSEIHEWGPILVLIRNRDAIAEVEVRGDEGYLRRGWLNWATRGASLHVRSTATDHILALIRSGKHGVSHSFNLVNQDGGVFCRFYTRTAAATTRFLEFCGAYDHWKEANS